MYNQTLLVAIENLRKGIIDGECTELQAIEYLDDMAEFVQENEENEGKDVKEGRVSLETVRRDNAHRDALHELTTVERILDKSHDADEVSQLLKARGTDFKRIEDLIHDKDPEQWTEEQRAQIRERVKEIEAKAKEHGISMKHLFSDTWLDFFKRVGLHRATIAGASAAAAAGAVTLARRREHKRR